MRNTVRVAVAAVCLILGAGTLCPQSVFAGETETYQLHMEGAQVAQAANGESVSISGSGPFSVHPKTTSATGTYTSSGAVLGSGSWVATQLLDFQPYGCVSTIFCGGKLMLRIVLTNSTSGRQFDGVLWVFCLISSPPPNSPEEGAKLDVIGVNNFNRIVSGGNVYIKTS